MNSRKPSFTNKTPSSLRKFLKYFRESSLSDIQAMHAVNNKKKLKEFLQSDMHIAEGDIVLGARNIPVMHHPYHKSAIDLTFFKWIDAILENPAKGVKLDFKGDGAAKYSLEYLRKTLTRDQEHRIIINTDILQGPSGNSPKYSTDFFASVRDDFPKVILSMGFTTEHRPGQKNQYTARMVKDILEVANSLTPPITICFRGEHFLDTRKEVVEKILKDPEITFTFFSSRYSWPGKKEWPRIFTEQYGNRAFVDITDQNINPILYDKSNHQMKKTKKSK